MSISKRILVVDDEPSVTRNLKLNLEAGGRFEVHTENDATRAVAAARSFRPDLILLDVVMPEADGGVVASQLQLDPLLRDIPVVFLTAIVSNKETGGQEIMSGGHTFIAKPVDIEELKQIIWNHISQCAAP